MTNGCHGSYCGTPIVNAPSSIIKPNFFPNKDTQVNQTNIIIEPLQLLNKILTKLAIYSSLTLEQPNI
jgi:hypothetical protein